LICFTYWRNFIVEQGVIIANIHNAHRWWDYGNWDLTLIAQLQSLIIECKVHHDFGFRKLFQDLFRLKVCEQPF
jgi:hypothetical protein